MRDVFGQALLDFYYDRFKGPLLLHNEYGEPEIIPVESYFRGYDEYTDLEIFALDQTTGKTLDIGAATGRHALYLQNKGIDITAMDVSPLCGQLMKVQGINNVMIMDILDYEGELFDTVFMLMNGIGIVGDLGGLKNLLTHLKNIIKPGGQLIFDSSDISYLYEGIKKPTHKYYGQLKFHYEYNGLEDDPFKWLYVDQAKLIEVARACEWNCMVVYEDDSDTYLARLIHA